MNKYLLLLFTSLLLFSCGKDEEVVPVSFFEVEDDYYAVNEVIRITAINKATVYSWDFGDGTTYTGKEPTHAYKEPGTYQIQLVTKIGSNENRYTKEIKIGRYYAYNVQLLQYVDNYWLEGGERSEPSLGNPDVYLKITELDPYTRKTLYQSSVTAQVKPEDLPLEWDISHVMLDIKPETFLFWNAGFNFYDARTNDRLIAGTDVGFLSTAINYDRSKNEGYFRASKGAPDSGLSFVVKFRIETR